MDYAINTVCEALARAVKHWSDRIFLSQGERQLTFAEVDAASDALARGLAARGVACGDRVCTLLDTGIDTLLVWFAINKLGAISAPVNTGYVGDYLRHQIADCGAGIVIAEAHYADRVAAVADHLPDVKRFVYRGERPGDALPWPCTPFDALPVAEGPGPDALVTPDDLAMLIYTSGTTGASKGCMISHGYACQQARTLQGAHGMREGDVVWMPMPLFHTVGTCGLTLPAMMVGARVELIPKFSVASFWTQIEESRANFALMVGSMLALVAAAPDSPAQRRCFGQLRVVAGGPFLETSREIFATRFGVAALGTPGYGLTEANIITRHRIGDPQPPGTSGRRFADYDVRIFDDQGVECPPDVVGEIVVRPQVRNGMFSGYWGRPEETLAVFRDLWFHTGDLGRFDADGHLIFVDRKKDYLRKGGENISSMEMEAMFARHPAIVEAAIHAVPSALGEDEVKLTYIPRDMAAVDHAALCGWAMGHIPRFAVPRYYEARADLPRTPTSKIRKVELRADGVTADTWDREMSGMAFRRPAKSESLSPTASAVAMK